MILKLLATPTKHFSYLVWYVCIYLIRFCCADIMPQHKNATENDLRREFEGFGSIERVRIVRDKNGRNRGYAFIVFERERDMKGTIIPLRG